jgi:hypothetical protein
VKLLHSLDSVDTHHHFLLGKAILEELVDVHSGLQIEQISQNEEHSLHELIVVQVDRVWVNLLTVQPILDIVACVEDRVVKDFHENAWMAVKCSENQRGYKN